LIDLIYRHQHPILCRLAKVESWARQISKEADFERRAISLIWIRLSGTAEYKNADDENYDQSLHFFLFLGRPGINRFS